MIGGRHGESKLLLATCLELPLSNPVPELILAHTQFSDMRLSCDLWPFHTVLSHSSDATCRFCLCILNRYIARDIDELHIRDTRQIGRYISQAVN